MKNFKIFIIILTFGLLNSCYDTTDFWADHDQLETSEECDTAQQELSTAASAFNSATEENFVTACENYQNALQLAITECGDPSGSYQGILNNLDCTDDGTSDACLEAEQATDIAENIYSALSSSDPNFDVACQTYKAALLNEIAQCGDDTGEILAEANSLPCQ